jgi:hypothetical protein
MMDHPTAENDRRNDRHDTAAIKPGGELQMCDHADDGSMNADRPTASADAETSRRGFLQSGAGILAAGATALPAAALAQGAVVPANAELSRL